MSYSAFLAWAEASPLAQFMQDQSWLFSILETFHFIGLSMLVGAIFVVDARVLGFLRGMSQAAAAQLIPIAVVGFAINLASGIGFFFSDPVTYGLNPAFKLKMALVAIAGLNALWFMTREHHRVMQLAPDAPARATARIGSALSILLWMCVIFLGRMLPAFEGSESFFPRSSGVQSNQELDQQAAFGCGEFLVELSFMGLA